VRSNHCILELEIIAARIRRNVLEICRQRGGYAAQGVALADIAACLYFDELRPDNEGWYYDRFVLSNGHDAIMTYSALAETGHYTMDELRTYNADGTKVDQSPIEGQLGFEITAGSLGQGPSQAAGLAWGLRQLGSDQRIYCLFSDGELQEGNVWEGAMFAAHQKLDNLCFIVDNNDMQASGHPGDVMRVEPVHDKFTAFGFQFAGLVLWIYRNYLTRLKRHEILRASPLSWSVTPVCGMGLIACKKFYQWHIILPKMPSIGIKGWTRSMRH